MAKTYDPIETQTLGSAAASVTFSSIPATYTDLVLVCNTASSASNPDLLMQFNGDTGTNYSDTVLTGNGTTASSARRSTQATIRVGYSAAPDTSTAFHNAVIHIMNYANATTNKTAIARSNHASYGTDLTTGLWRSTAAITSVLLKVSSSTFAVGSTFTLYGIKAA